MIGRRARRQLAGIADGPVPAAVRGMLLDLLATPQGLSVRQAAASLAVTETAACRWLLRLTADGLAAREHGRFYLATEAPPVLTGYRSRP